MEIPFKLYPIHIIQDRYNGIYSKGDWLAISRYHEYRDSDIENDPLSDDCSARNFWLGPVPKWIGVGNTPNEALENLLSKM